MESKAPVRLALKRVASTRWATLRLASTRSAAPRSAPARLAPERLTLLRLAPSSLALLRSGVMSRFCSRHAFQVLTLCFKTWSCLEFAIACTSLCHASASAGEIFPTVLTCFGGWRGGHQDQSTAPGMLPFPGFLILFPLELRELFFSFFSLVNPF